MSNRGAIQRHGPEPEECQGATMVSEYLKGTVRLNYLSTKTLPRFIN